MNEGQCERDQEIISMRFVVSLADGPYAVREERIVSLHSPTTTM